MGVLTKYATKKVLHFNHNDFLMAIRADLTPLLGNTGLWVIKNYMTRQAEKGNDEKKKRARTILDIIQNYLDNGIDQLSRLNKFNMMNKFGPKKMPNQVLKRSDQMLYSWTHYAPQSYFEDIKKTAEIISKSKSKGSVSSLSINKCDYCGAPEPTTIPHKRCSQCKQRLYCSIDCQRLDWKNGHNKQCKILVAEAAKKALKK
jgi:hypothetical protein